MTSLLCVIDFIGNHSDSKIDEFAQLLLKVHVPVEGLHNKSREKEEFVYAVLKKRIKTVGGPIAAHIIHGRVCMHGLMHEECSSRYTWSATNGDIVC